MASQYRRRLLMLNTIAKVAKGNPTIITDSSSRRLKKLNIYGQSEQDSTTGAQLLDPSLFYADETTDGITYTTNEDGSVKIEGTATSSANKYLGEYIDIFENGQIYTCNLSQNGYTGGFNITYNDDRHDYLPTLTVDKSTMISIKPYIQVRTNVTKNETIYPMVNKGSSVLPFEPYTGGKPSPSPDYPQDILSKEVSEIKVTGANLLNYTNKGVIDSEYYTVDDGYVCALKKDSRVNSTVPESMKLPSGKYTISIETDLTEQVFLQLVDKQAGTQIANVNNLTLKTTTFDLEKEYSVSFKVYCGVGITTLAKAKVQINRGDIALPWEPYKSQTITLTEPITLRGIPVSSGGNITIDGQQYISDVICEKDGVIGIERNIHERTLNGTESWNIGTQSENTTRFYTPNEDENDSASSLKTLSNYLQYNLMWSKDEEGVYVDLNNTVLRINKSIVGETQESINQWSTFEPLPEDIQVQYKALKTYYPNTVIQTGCWNEVTYSAKRGG